MPPFIEVKTQPQGRRFTDDFDAYIDTAHGFFEPYQSPFLNPKPSIPRRLHATDDADY
jgi:hypothetical protein